MKSKGVIIQASSRSKGNTEKVVSFVQNQTNFDVVDLSKLRIEHFDYDFNNQNDDFSNLIQTIADQYDTVLFATPVYWYTMSGLLKVFLDRISDCLIKDKETGRKLRGKSLGLIISSSDENEIEGFDIPIRSTAHYLGMTYLNYVHTWVEEGTIPTSVENRLKKYSKKVIEKPVNN